MISENKKKQTHKKIRYFVEAVWEIEAKEGFENITIKKIADEAGYNVSTIYTYFENLNHLLAFASLKHLREYAIALSECLQNVDDPLTIYLKTWECFNYHSFSKPLIYKKLFFGDYAPYYKKSLDLYYEIFPEHLPPKELILGSLHQEKDIFKRDSSLLLLSSKAGIIPPENLNTISTINIMLSRGMLDYLSAGGIEYSAEELSKTITNHQAHALLGFGVPCNAINEFLETS